MDIAKSNMEYIVPLIVRTDECVQCTDLINAFDLQIFGISFQNWLYWNIEMLIWLLYEQYVLGMRYAMCSVQFIHDIPVNYTFVLI